MPYDAHAVTHVPPNTQGGEEKRESITNKRQHYEYKFFPEQVSQTKKSPNSRLTPRNFANFRAKTIRHLNPVITRLGAPLQIRPR